MDMLNIPISEKTRRKLGALAILTGKKFDSIESEISEMLDTILSEQIDQAMASMDGRARQEFMSAPLAPPPPAAMAKTSFADLAEESNSVIEDLAGNVLSNDEDTGAPSIEEQINAEGGVPETLARQSLKAQAQTDDLQAPDLDIEDVGSNAEAFLDNALEQPEVESQSAVSRYSRGRPTGRAFNPKKRQARVSDYTGDSEADSDGDLF